MTRFMSNLLRSLPMILVLVALVLSACLSRYRLDLFQTIDETRRKTKIEDSMFIPGVVIGDPMADSKLDLGDGNCVVLTTSTRGEPLESKVEHSLFVGFFENLKCKLFLQLPSRIKPEKISLVANSLVQMMAHYEIPLEDKLFLPVEGELVVDSIVDARLLFGEVNGTFTNHLGQSIFYDGRFKVKIAN